MPLFAVLGNHDYGKSESPDLQRRVVPEYVASWHMPPGDVEVRELAGGLSLVLVDTNRVLRGHGEREVVRALRSSRGPVAQRSRPIIPCWTWAGATTRASRSAWGS